MVQQTFTDMEYANRTRTMRREVFLYAMAFIAPFCAPKERGGRLISPETTLRMYLRQNMFGRSSEGKHRRSDSK
ncbi:hypothetical protein TAMA11512_09820 [Selenomonas sp. TAMA-11512]|nr:hypothetical protein TAMA11512_09820 [Selenomonas sp. TAMA-11512]